MKKKIILYSFIVSFSIFLFLYFNTTSDKPTGYDTSQQVILESKGGFVPEQKTDYIFTTTKVENQFNIQTVILSLLIVTAIIIIIVRKKNKNNQV